MLTTLHVCLCVQDLALLLVNHLQDLRDSSSMSGDLVPFFSSRGGEGSEIVASLESSTDCALVISLVPFVSYRSRPLSP